MTLIEAKDYAARKLRGAGVLDYLLESDLILCKVLGCDRAWMMAHKERSIFDYELEYLETLLERRCKREPLAYVFGEAYFYGRSFFIGEGVLIPRPETEILVETALSFVEEGVILDWGTGSGCVVISLLLENPKLSGVALDISPKALSWMWRNVKKFDLFARMLLWHESVRLPQKYGNHSLDMIVSNPPYIPTKEISCLMPEVKCYEPLRALDGGYDGMCWYRLLFEKAPLWLKEGGWLLVESGGKEQTDAIISMAPLSFKLHEVKNLNGGVSIVIWEYNKNCPL